MLWTTAIESSHQRPNQVSCEQCRMREKDSQQQQQQRIVANNEQAEGRRLVGRMPNVDSFFK